MGENRFPVDVRNAGQVFACMGLMEAAEGLVGPTEGGFDMSAGQFQIRSEGSAEPVRAVFEFLAQARVEQLAPPDYDELTDVKHIEAFPAPQGEKTGLPVRLTDGNRSFVIGHWTDGAQKRNSFKLYAGNRSGYSIGCAMLNGGGKNKGVNQLWAERPEEVLASPFGVTTPMAGSYNLDPRGAWTAIDAGYSPNDHGDAVASSPIVELLAAWGLENARPIVEKRKVRYSVWTLQLPLLLARAALGGGLGPSIPSRCFQFELALAGKNKVVNFAEEVGV